MTLEGRSDPVRASLKGHFEVYRKQVASGQVYLPETRVPDGVYPPFRYTSTLLYYSFKNPNIFPLERRRGGSKKEGCSEECKNPHMCTCAAVAAVDMAEARRVCPRHRDL